jgi:hypothetical protein
MQEGGGLSETQRRSGSVVVGGILMFGTLTFGLSPPQPGSKSSAPKMAVKILAFITSPYSRRSGSPPFAGKKNPAATDALAAEIKVLAL